MKQLGETYWDQLSIWEFAPDTCIEGYRKVNGDILNYVLKEVIEITSSNSWKIVYTVNKEKIPNIPLMDEIYLTINSHRTKIG